MLAILEFSTPPNPVFRALYRFYSGALLPAVGGWISGDRSAYTYLPDSVRKFPGAELLAAEMEAAGFTRVRFRRMTCGIVALHTGLSGLRRRKGQSPFHCRARYVRKWGQWCLSPFHEMAQAPVRG